MKYAFLTFLIIAFFSCQEDNPKINIASKELNLPAFENGSLNTSDIGRVLFYDTRLSLNNSVSCASCHKQINAFADNKTFSEGYLNERTNRNSLAINSLGLNGLNSLDRPLLFWDGREFDLQTMVMRPLTNHVEMGMADLDAVFERVSNANYYKELFSLVFRDGIITLERISMCLSEFVSGIASMQSKFDKVLDNEAIFSALEEEGFNLFFNTYPCGNCHNLGTFGYGSSLTTFINIGLDLVPTDKGRANITNDPSDEGAFKTPSLRNTSLTAPYMHDGRFATLEEVIDHYNSGLKKHPNLDDRLRQPSGEPINLQITPHQKQALVAFLSTLTDYNLTSNSAFSDPFIR